jgi:hypothetical protein
MSPEQAGFWPTMGLQRLCGLAQEGSEPLIYMLCCEMERTTNA